MKLGYPQKTNGMYILSRTDMDTIAERVLGEYMPQVLEKPQPLNIDDLVQEHLYLEIRPANLSCNRSIYGAMVFQDGPVPCYSRMYEPAVLEAQEGTMLIDNFLREPSMLHPLRFTKAHEASHWMLHRSYHAPDKRQYDFRCAKPAYVACRERDVERFRAGKSRARTDEEWEEWQADALAAALLMPREMFLLAAKTAFDHNGITRGFLVKGQRVEDSISAIEDLSGIFSVSKKAVQIRLRQNDLLFMNEQEVARYMSALWQ